VSNLFLMAAARSMLFMAANPVDLDHHLGKRSRQ
jgi:hypothetical protein